MIQVYTDGSCMGNPGLGGFGVVAFNEAGEIIYAYQERSEKITTNNREEMKAILHAVDKFGSQEELYTINTDSSYCANTFNTWIFNWAHNGWRNASKKTPENLDLVQSFYSKVQSGKRVIISKVAGHKGIEGNELADKLATGKISSDTLWKE